MTQEKELSETIWPNFLWSDKIYRHLENLPSSIKRIKEDFFNLNQMIQDLPISGSVRSLRGVIESLEELPKRLEQEINYLAENKLKAEREKELKEIFDKEIKKIDFSKYLPETGSKLKYGNRYMLADPSAHEIGKEILYFIALGKNNCNIFQYPRAHFHLNLPSFETVEIPQRFELIDYDEKEIERRKQEKLSKLLEKKQELESKITELTSDEQG